ncbi:MauE/DoxX family redox-associated membrane protein [Mucilaginibacter sp.]|uniref:MauE/DoxX family redox-associated membrane protein n=1 Tax=Mucilaginibacter sp. TaxID=1882438 RepID=UPI003565D64A
MQHPSIKNSNRISFQDVVAFFLIVLFIYTAVSKLLDFSQFQKQMELQTLPAWLQLVLIWSLPTIEIITGLLLMFIRTRMVGFYLSALLLIIFTGYIALVLLNYFGRVPCSCGGVIRTLGWGLHLIFNVFFLLLSFLGIYLINRERRIDWH